MSDVQQAIEELVNEQVDSRIEDAAVSYTHLTLPTTPHV